MYVLDLGHAWSGYNLNIKFADLFFTTPAEVDGGSEKTMMEVPFFGAKGPSATNLITEFFFGPNE